MIFAILIAVAVAFHSVALFFPAMLLVIGGRYLTFATLYGMKIYWAFGATLALAALPIAALRAPVFVGALVGALIEYAFGAVIFFRLGRS